MSKYKRNMNFKWFCIVCFFFAIKMCSSYKIEGKVLVPSEDQLVNTRLIVNDGAFRGFLKPDGSFVIHNIPSGSHVLEVVSPKYIFEQVRVDVSSKGKFRARKLNNLKPSAVSLLRYPLELKAMAMPKYFQKREPDGSFVIHNIPSGSHVLEVVSPKYIFEQVRVDVSSKGKFRARKLNNLKPSAVSLLRYPLELKAMAMPKYFQKRETFSIFDMLKNPMVLMMVLPLLMFAVLPKLMNTSDPEVRKEMEESMKVFNQSSSLPDAAEMMSSWFSKGPKKKAITSGKAGKSKSKKVN